MPEFRPPTPQFDATRFIKEIGRGAQGARDLSREDSALLWGAVLEGALDDLQLGALLIGMRIKGESNDELLGFKDALDKRTPQLALPISRSKLVVIPSYNGVRRQPNLMPLLALLLARRGIPVLIHGRYDFATRVDPSTLFAELAIPRADSAEQASELIARHHVAFIALVNLLPNLDKLLALRLRLGLRNSGHTLAKLIDPAKEKSVRLVTVTHPEYLQKMRIFLANSKATALLFRSTEGEAFANPKRRPELIAFKAGQHEMSFPAEDGGTSPIEGMPDVAENETTARWIRDMLAGHVAIPQPILDQVAVLARLASEV